MRIARETALGSSYGLASASLVIISSITDISRSFGGRCIPSNPDLSGPFCLDWESAVKNEEEVNGDRRMGADGAKPRHAVSWTKLTNNLMVNEE